MITKIIGLAEFRANISNIWKYALAENIRFIVLVRSKPAFEVRPITENRFDID